MGNLVLSSPSFTRSLKTFPPTAHSLLLLFVHSFETSFIMKSSILAVLGGASTALAAVRGFNYASQGQSYDGFASQFKTAASLAGADDFTSARLYTMIQEGTTNTPIDAIHAAIDTNTTLLLGLWASVDQSSFDNEITALKSAISQYGSSFAELVVGISVGSEDLYRISETGIAAGSGVGQSPDVLVDYIGQVRSAIKGTSLGSKPVGHVDTWNVYVNGSNCDFLGLDEYPYYQTTDVNTIGNSSFLFFQAYDRVQAVSGGKPIWITEAGWPVSGPTSNLAVASVDDAETFWQGVACALENRGINFCCTCYRYWFFRCWCHRRCWSNRHADPRLSNGNCSCRYLHLHRSCYQV